MPELAAVIPLIVWLILIGAACAIVYWLVNSVGLPPPFKIAILALVAVAILLALGRILTTGPWRL